VQSAKAVGIQPEIATFRGCTDAAIMSERGLPTVILGCGWQNAHQLTEWVSAQDLDRTTNHLVSIITNWPSQGPHTPILNKQQEASGKPLQYQPPLWPKMTRSPNWKP
ncbi:MAG: M20/M25/M40 family metallo-hydrolase, partial [Cyanobacteria bacterium]|nr:M20/M25/M40 family metallo-hydrolase [Cyanobacteriota bacterium]